MKLRIALIPLMLIAFVFAGCARFPLDPGVTAKHTVSFDFTVAGTIDPMQHYFIALDMDQDKFDGPKPAIGAPWGNGWGTGSISHYVYYNAGQAQVYRVVPNTGLMQVERIGPPLEISLLNNNKTLHVMIDLDTLATNDITADEIDNLDVNIITTDQIILSPDYNGSKSIDWLGISGNNYISIPTVNTRFYSNNGFVPGTSEGSGDVNPSDPNIDLVDWSIEVRIR